VVRKLRILRKQKRLSQEALAHQAGIDRNYVRQIEREEKLPTIDMIKKLATALAIDPVAFTTRPQKRRS
jgi:transcriptional regulator with XRE-family HTH domain